MDGFGPSPVANEDAEFVTYHRAGVKVYKDKHAKREFNSKTFEFNIKFGKEIGNHAILLNESNPIIHPSDDPNYPHDVRRETIVLCLTPGSFQPFASWRRVIGIGITATGELELIEYCIHGHYHQRLDEAMYLYDERVEAFHATSA